MRSRTWNDRSLYRSDSLSSVARELARYSLDLVGLYGVRWDKGGTVSAGDYIFLYTTENYQLLRQQILLAIGCHI